QGDSKIGAGDVAFFEKLVYRAIDSGDWNGHCAATAESVGVNAEHLAFHADKRSTGESRIKLEIKANTLINPAAAPGSPLPTDAANDAGASDQISRSGAPKGQDEIGKLQLGWIAKLWNLGLAAFKLQHGEISSGIPACELTRNSLSIWQRHFDFVLPPERAFRSDTTSLE